MNTIGSKKKSKGVMKVGLKFGSIVCAKKKEKEKFKVKDRWVLMSIAAVVLPKSGIESLLDDTISD